MACVMPDPCVHCGHDVTRTGHPWHVMHTVNNGLGHQLSCPDGSGRIACLANAGVE